MNVNVVALTGNLTRDPEQFADGKVTKFGLAVNEREKNSSGDWEDRPSFFDVTCFGKQGDNVKEYLSKGSPVAVQGRLRQERWQDKDGQNRSKVTITAERVQFLRGAESNGGGRTTAAEAREAAEVHSAAAGTDDDIPF